MTSLTQIMISLFTILSNIFTNINLFNIKPNLFIPLWDWIVQEVPVTSTLLIPQGLIGLMVLMVADYILTNALSAMYVIVHPIACYIRNHGIAKVQHFVGDAIAFIQLYAEETMQNNEKARQKAKATKKAKRTKAKKAKAFEKMYGVRNKFKEDNKTA